MLGHLVARLSACRARKYRIRVPPLLFLLGSPVGKFVALRLPSFSVSISSPCFPVSITPTCFPVSIRSTHSPLVDTRRPSLRPCRSQEDPELELIRAALGDEYRDFMPQHHRRRVTYVSRLQSVQTAVGAQIKAMAREVRSCHFLATVSGSPCGAVHPRGLATGAGLHPVFHPFVTVAAQFLQRVPDLRPFVCGSGNNGKWGSGKKARNERLPPPAPPPCREVSCLCPASR